eukprot:857799-Prymnesium_polylepis.1
MRHCSSSGHCGGTLRASCTVGTISYRGVGSGVGGGMGTAGTASLPGGARSRPASAGAAQSGTPAAQRAVTG